jgi:hypothetical protein
LDDLVTHFRQKLSPFPDKRIGKNTRYRMEDTELSAFSVFFTQSPSFLAVQRSMRDRQGRDNAQSLFGVIKIASDNHIRDLMDDVTAEFVLPVFGEITRVLNELGYLDSFRSFNNDLLIPIDDTQYHSSKTIHCDQCNEADHNGEITYSHTVITPAIGVTVFFLLEFGVESTVALHGCSPPWLIVADYDDRLHQPHFSGLNSDHRRHSLTRHNHQRHPQYLPRCQVKWDG